MICAKCKEEKITDSFTESQIKKGDGRWCKECVKIKNKLYRQTNKDKLKKYKQTDSYKQKSKNYKERNKKEIKKWSKEYYLSNKDRFQNYYIENKEKIKERVRKWDRKRMKTDLIYRLRKNTSSYIRNSVKHKGGNSILNNLPYTIDELKNHLESQFESWMTWDNWGNYNSTTWNDNDSTTWTWNIDHIIPHSNLPYNSMNDENFKKCWSLNNLRPYSAKQNIIDGSSRIRHNII